MKVILYHHVCMLVVKLLSASESSDLMALYKIVFNFNFNFYADLYVGYEWQDRL